LAALSSAAGEKSFSFGTVYVILGKTFIPNGFSNEESAVYLKSRLLPTTVTNC
jgi:hypothetical protein